VFEFGKLEFSMCCSHCSWVWSVKRICSVLSYGGVRMSIHGIMFAVRDDFQDTSGAISLDVSQVKVHGRCSKVPMRSEGNREWTAASGSHVIGLSG